MDATGMQGMRKRHVRGQRGVGRLAAAVILMGTIVGCVERTVSINTEPQGATVMLNDQDIGRTPVKVPFTWYGDYDLVVRKEGYETVKTNHRLQTPWYELPGIDLFSECLIPFTIHDDRIVPTIALDQARRPTQEALLKNASEMRAEAGIETP